MTQNSKLKTIAAKWPAALVWQILAHTPRLFLEHCAEHHLSGYRSGVVRVIVRGNCQETENAQIKVTPFLAVYCCLHYRIARNDFHNCDFAASTGIQAKESTKTISETKG
jgi:hypothetical protein